MKLDETTLGVWVALLDEGNWLAWLTQDRAGRMRFTYRFRWDKDASWLDTDSTDRYDFSADCADLDKTIERVRLMSKELCALFKRYGTGNFTWMHEVLRGDIPAPAFIAKVEQMLIGCGLAHLVKTPGPVQ